MRDSDIYGLVEERTTLLADMVASDTHQMQRGLSMLRTRQDAIERLLFASRWGILKTVFLQFISPTMLRRTLTSIHSEEIEKYNENRRRTLEKNSIKAAPQPGLIQVH